jgi:hypothetical protein
LVVAVVLLVGQGEHQVTIQYLVPLLLLVAVVAQHKALLQHLMD